MNSDSGGAVKPKVLIIGGGFAGMNAAKELSGKGLDITLVDKENHHLFQPLLYQVAGAALSAPSVAAPLRHILSKHKDVQVLLGQVDNIDTEAKEVLLHTGTVLKYDALLLSAGATHSYFGKEEWSKYAPGIKTLQDAANVRQLVLNSFEAAELATSEEDRSLHLTFAIIGAGPTGVELAGSLAEIARDTLAGEFRNIDTSKARIVLIDGAPRPLTAFPENLSEAAGKALDQLGVERLHNARVTNIDFQNVSYERDGKSEVLSAGVVLWAAGVKASPLAEQLTKNGAAKIDRAGRLQVDANLSVPGLPGVFAAGDLVAIAGKNGPVPGVAPAAKQMGRTAAKNIVAYFNGTALSDFAYKDFGSLATIGRHKAVVWFGKWQFSGYPAWLFWLFAHIFFLIGWRNRFVVLIDWAMAYWTKDRWARIISQKVEPQAEITPERPVLKKIA